MSKLEAVRPCVVCILGLFREMTNNVSAKSSPLNSETYISSLDVKSIFGSG